MSQLYVIAYVPWCKRWEGCCAWLYLDTRGNVTIWVGFEVPSALAAQSLPLYLSGGTLACTEQEKAAAWETVSAMQPGRLPASYEYSGCPVMLPSDGDALLMAKLDASDAELQADYPGFESFPDAVKMALLDMDWNLGDPKLRNTYPRFDAAVDRQDWATAALQCHRNGISDERNAWTAQCFQSQESPAVSSGAS